MTQIVHLVEASTLPEMLEETLNDRYEPVKTVNVDDHSLDFDHDDRCVVSGRAEFLNSAGHPTMFTFEVNVGTHKDDHVIFDELEVIIHH